MEKFLLIDVDDEVKELEYDDGKKEDILQFFYRNIGCETVEEVVHTILPLRLNRIVLIVDEIGVYKELSYNPLASNLTSFKLRGNVIVAKIDGDEFTGLSDEDIEFLNHYLGYLKKGLEDYEYWRL